MNIKLLSIAIFTASSITGTLAFAQEHADVSPYVSDGRIVTGAYEDATLTLFPAIRVIGIEIGEDPGDPNFGDLGFNARPLSELPSGATTLTSGTGLAFRFEPVGGNAGNHTLLYWDGDGAVSFNDVPGAAPGESLRINRGGQNATAGRATGTVNGFSIGNASSTGTIHAHLNVFLQDTTGDSSASATVPNGIYLVEMVLTNPGGSALDSEPLWVAFNRGMDEEVHESAIEFVESTLVPEPSGLATILLAGVTLLRRKRRNR